LLSRFVDMGRYAVSCILLVHNHRHLLEGTPDLVLGQAMEESIRDQLRGDAQRCTIVHEAYILQVRHRGAANAKGHSAHNVAQGALGILTQLMLDGLRLRPLTDKRWRQQVPQLAGRPHGQLHLPGGDIHAVVVDAMQCGHGW